MREKLLKLYSIKVELCEGHGGIFTISQSDKILFSKQILGRFPTNEDLLRLELDYGRQGQLLS